MNVIADLKGSSCVDPKGVNASVIHKAFVVFISLGSLSLISPRFPTTFLSIVVCLVKPTFPANPVDNANTLNLKIEIFKTDIFKVAYKLNETNPCYMCARMRRGSLYDKAKELGCNKIALGHHFNDVIETTLLSIFYSAEVKTMLPKLHSTNYSGIDLIRPLYLVREDDIIAWARHNDLHFINCACEFSKKSKDNKEISKRLEIKELIKELKKKNKEIDHNIFKSMSNINLDCVLGTVKGMVHKSFLDDYEETK